MKRRKQYLHPLLATIAIPFPAIMVGSEPEAGIDPGGSAPPSLFESRGANDSFGGQADEE